MGLSLDAKRDPTQINYCLITTTRYVRREVGSLLKAFSQGKSITANAGAEVTKNYINASQPDNTGTCEGLDTGINEANVDKGPHAASVQGAGETA